MRGGTPLLKRFTKRWTRRLVAAGGRCLHRLGATHPPSGVRILTYHRIAADPLDPFAVDPAEFSRQMQLLLAGCRMVSLEEAISELESSSDPPGTIALTIDDGTRDFLTDGLPTIRRLGLPATLFVSPLKVGMPGFLDWDELSEIRDAGISVGSHGLDHQSLGKLSGGELQDQVYRSRQMLEDRLGIRVTCLAYPFGTSRDFNATVKEEVRRAGYQFACTAINGVNRRGVDLLELKRTKIEQGDGPIFEWTLQGCLDGWEFIDRHLSLLQNRYP